MRADYLDHTRHVIDAERRTVQRLLEYAASLPWHAAYVYGTKNPREAYEWENIRLRDVAGRQQRWKSNIGMTRDGPGIRKSRWPSPPGAAINFENYPNDLKS